MTWQRDSLSLQNPPRVGDVVKVFDSDPRYYLVIEEPVVSWLNRFEGWLVEFMCVDLETHKRGLQHFEQETDVEYPSAYILVARVK